MLLTDAALREIAMKAAQESNLGVVSRETALRDVHWVAEYLNVSTSWVYQATSAGTIPCVRLGAAVRFNPADIRAWLLEKTKR